MIRDQGVSDDYRAVGVFDETRPLLPVGQWIQEHTDEYDFKKFGVPGWFPTRTLEEWQAVRKAWEPWVFREPNSEMKRPVIPYTKKPGRKKVK